MANNIFYQDSIYREALAGTLKTVNPSEKDHDLDLVNHIHLPIGYAPIGTNGEHGYTNILNYNEASNDQGYKSKLHVYHLLTNALTGAFIGVFKLAPNKNYKVGRDKPYNFLFEPNSLGMPPQASNATPIPSNSWSVVVGISQKQKDSDGNKVIIVREQSWDMSGISYALAPGETKQISVTHEFGRDSTASNSDSMSDSVGVSASAGWGPVNASVSASLSQTSSTSHDVSIRESDTSFHVDVLENKYDTGLVVYFWKLMDTITVYKLNDADTASDVLSSVSVPIGPLMPIAYTIDGTKVELFDASKLDTIKQEANKANAPAQ